MDDYIASLHDASVSLVGGNFVGYPPLVSQRSDAHMSVGPPHGRGKVAATRSKKTNFSVYEDNMLCKSWLEISCDPITNTGQRKESFWLRVLNRYNTQCKNYPKRSQKSIMSCWDYIKAEVSKFSGYMAEMIRFNPSGMSDSDKSVAAAADFASIEKHNFSLMHCWHILKDEPKWMELKRRMDKPQTNSAGDVTPHDSISNSNSTSNTMDHDVSSPGSCTRKRPMGRDAAKADKKKSSSSSNEYVAKMHELSVQKISLFKETEAERKVRLDEMVNLEKVKVEEAREHRRMMLELERERLELDKKRLQIDAEKKEKEEDERILAINLDHCQPYQQVYYQALQEEIIEKLNARRHGPS